MRAWLLTAVVILALVTASCAVADEGALKIVRGATAADRAAYRDFTTWVDGRIRPTQIRGYNRKGKWWRGWRMRMRTCG